MAKICEISGKTSNNGYQVSHSHIRTKKIQNINLKKKRIWSIKKKQWIKVRLSTKAMKSIHKNII
uniref:Large ribosomal subunit protein bL28c n=1 Tax=Kapraunia schneideri TaxID=717899 RepID=A0A1Z1MSN4_9FLOR|nr:ribosomal protein L28 [Kapraunia schneideri]ARW68889.1 ribosomal protein L28 [Kapraunia schneideri]